jgi:hypothetical protein
MKEFDPRTVEWVCEPIGDPEMKMLLITTLQSIGMEAEERIGMQVQFANDYIAFLEDPYLQNKRIIKVFARMGSNGAMKVTFKELLTAVERITNSKK